MRILLAMVIPAWVGAAIGATLDAALPGFWAFWVLCGVGIALALLREGGRQ